MSWLADLTTFCFFLWNLLDLKGTNWRLRESQMNQNVLWVEMLAVSFPRGCISDIICSGGFENCATAIRFSCARVLDMFLSHIRLTTSFSQQKFASHLPDFLSWTIIQLFWRQFIMNEMIVNILAGSNVDGNRYDLYCWHRLIRVTRVLGLCFLACGLGHSWQTFDSFWKAKTMTSSFIFCCLKWSFN